MTGLFLAALACACGETTPGALEHGDPLHEHAIGLPPPAQWSPPAQARTDSQMVQVPPPEFSSGMFPCSRCHAGGAATVKDTRPAMPHAKHIARDLGCADCHAPDDADADPKIPPVELCLECHEDMKEEPAPIQAYFKAIQQADGKYVLPRRWPTTDTIANHQGHAKAKVECAACHGPATDGPYTKPRSVPLMELCVDCHTQRHVAAKCETCHQKIRDPQHKNIVLRHAEDQRGCLDCHNPADRDTLRLANGTPVPFSESYRLCGQCHGPKLRDWKAGLHGKRTGMWDGTKEYLLCVHCHTNPHAPQYPAQAPDPPPTRPEDIR